MYDISDPFKSICGTSKTESNISVTCSIELKKGQTENRNGYQTFFENQEFEKYIETYPKTEVRKRVLGRVPIPD
jgi:hypothetical protein